MVVVGIIQWRIGFIDNKAMMGETDSFYRLLAIQEYLKDGGSILLPFIKLPLEGVWLSGYFSIFIILGKIGFNEMGFRIFTWICGLLLVLLVWLIANRLIKKTGTLWWLLVLFTFAMSPLMMQVNFEMLGEPVMSFLLLVSLFFLLKEKQFWTIFFLFLSQSIRYESWFIVPFFWIYIIYFIKSWSWKNKIVVLLGTLFFPLIWMILNSIQNGNLLFFYSNRQFYLGLSPYSGNFFVALKEWVLRLQQYVSMEWFFLWIFGVICMFLGGHNKRKWWAAMSIYSFFIVVLQLWLNSTAWFAPRYIYMVFVLSVPVLLVAVELIVKIYRQTNIVGKIIILLFFISFTSQYIRGIPMTKTEVESYFIPNQEVKILTDTLKNKSYTSNSEVFYLWLKDSPWLSADFSYYLINRGVWKNVVSINNEVGLQKINKGSFLIAEKGLVEEGKEFSEILNDSYIFETWIRN